MGKHKVCPYGFLNLNGKHVNLPYPIKSLNSFSYIFVENGLKAYHFVEYTAILFPRNIA